MRFKLRSDQNGPSKVLPASRTQCISAKLMIFLVVAAVSAAFCSRSFHPIRCDFIAAFSERTAQLSEDGRHQDPVVICFRHPARAAECDDVTREIEIHDLLTHGVLVSCCSSDLEFDQDLQRASIGSGGERLISLHDLVEPEPMRNELLGVDLGSAAYDFPPICASPRASSCPTLFSAKNCRQVQREGRAASHRSPVNGGVTGRIPP